MRTEPEDLAGRSFDVLVVGGGIHAAGVAREAAVRGAATLLVARGDFAPRAEAGPGVIHGGLGGLEQGRAAEVREALAERERLLRLAPHLVHPLPLLAPFFHGQAGSAAAFAAALRRYGALVRRSTLPAPVRRGPGDCARLVPGLRTRGLREGVAHWEAWTDETRLTVAVLEAAAAAGARLGNHLEVIGQRRGAVLLLDRLGGNAIDVRARQVVNAAGPAADAVREALGLEPRAAPRARGAGHLVLPPTGGEVGLSSSRPNGARLAAVSRPEALLFGAVEGACAVAELRAALAALLEAAPDPAAVPDRAAGARPPAGPELVLDERCAAGSVHTVAAARCTTHRAVAERLLDRIAGAGAPSPTRTAPLPGGAGPREPGDPLWWRHGSRAAEVRALARADRSLLEPVCPHRPFLGVEARFAIQRQGAVTFADVALRALADPRGPCAEDACLLRLHEICAGALPARANLERDPARLRAALFSDPRLPAEA